jgi:hypothetical protein
MARTRGRAATALLAGALTAASCGHPASTTPPIRVATPRIAPSRLKLAPAEADGLTRFDNWPPACGLLTVADLKALLPQVSKVEQTPHEQRIRVTNLGAGAADDERDAPGTACETRFWVAGDERRPHARPDVVRVADIAVGDTDTVQDNYDAVAKGGRPVAGFGARACVLAGTDYYCRMPHIAFSVGTGPTLFIARFTGQPKRTDAHAYWVSTVLPQLVRSVAAKLPST